MDEGAMRALVDNVAALMAARGDTQASVAKRGNISQRAVGYVLTYGRSHHTSPTLRTVEGLAKAFEVQPWALLIPGMSSADFDPQRFGQLIFNYRSAPEEGRANVERVAAHEVRYGGAHHSGGRRATEG